MLLNWRRSGWEGSAEKFIRRPETCATICLLDDQEAGLDTLVGDAVPHHARLAGVDGMPELDHLAGVQGRVVMHSSKAALAVVEQAAADFLVRRIAEGQS